MISSCRNILSLQLTFSDIDLSDSPDLSNLKQCDRLKNLFLVFDKNSKVDIALNALSQGLSDHQSISYLMLEITNNKINKKEWLPLPTLLKSLQKLISFSLRLCLNEGTDTGYEQIKQSIIKAINLTNFTIIAKFDDAVKLVPLLPALTVMNTNLESFSINLENVNFTGLLIFPVKHLTQLKLLHIRLRFEHIKNFYRDLYMEISSLKSLKSLLLELHWDQTFDEAMEGIKAIANLEALEYYFFSTQATGKRFDELKELILHKMQAAINHHKNLKTFDFENKLPRIWLTLSK